jgi:hypothetical protein
MKLHHNDKNNLLRRLPNLKLSYENIHKKVSSEMYFLIPKGKKHLVWFTYFQDKKVCIFVEINPGSQKSISNMVIVPQSFEKKMVLGTILFGTLFSMNDKSFFSTENIHYYCGKNIENDNELSKLNLLKHIFDNKLKQTIITKHGICIGLPVIESSFENAISCAKQLPYEIYSIQQRNFQDNKHLYNSTLYKSSTVNEAENRIFVVKADIQNDVYHLHVKNNQNHLEKYDVAAIPDYKTSVMMNKIFRKIKENANLDALEESDDDEEFEDIREDRFVFLDKSITMECSFQKKTNTFVPIKIVTDRQIATLSSINESKQYLEQSNARKNTQHNSYNRNNNYQNNNYQNNNNRNRNNNNQTYNGNHSNNTNKSNHTPNHNHRGQRQTYNSHSQINHYRQSFNQ